MILYIINNIVLYIQLLHYMKRTIESWPSKIDDNRFRILGKASSIAIGASMW